MALRYPIIFIIVIIISIIFIYWLKKKNKNLSYTKGSKIANTSLIEKNNYYLNLLKKYKLYKRLIQISCIISIICCTFLLGRLVANTSDDADKYNRDIVLCMDVSDSVNELNSQLVTSLKDTVKSLKNERFGITIFNTSAVSLVPLTDDYDFVLGVLDQIDKSLNFDYESSVNSDDYFYVNGYILNGTSEGYERGSSLIGDGLASCVYNFNTDDEDRSRLIIFSTDNSLSGTPLLTLSEAAEISKEKNIKVFGIGTEYMGSQDESEFRQAVEKTNGKYYAYNSSTVSSIVSDIEKTSKSLLKNNNLKKQTDIPMVPFIILIGAIIVLFYSSKKVV